jgi:hypothetical protein
MASSVSKKSSLRQIDSDNFPLILTRNDNTDLVIWSAPTWYPCTHEINKEEGILAFSDIENIELRELYNFSRPIEWAALLAVAADAALKAAIAYIVQSFIGSYLNSGSSVQKAIRAALHECLRIVQQMIDQEELDRAEAACDSMAFYIEGLGENGVKEVSQLDTPIMRAHESFSLCERRLALIGGYTHSFALLSTMLLQQFEIDRNDTRRARLISILDRFDNRMELFESKIERNALKEFSKVYEIMFEDDIPFDPVMFNLPSEIDANIPPESRSRKIHYVPTGRYTYRWRNIAQGSYDSKGGAEKARAANIASRFSEIKGAAIVPGRAHSRLLRKRAK